MKTRTLLLVAAFSAWISLVPSAPGGGLLREVYLNIGGGSVASLTNSPNFPNSPDLTNIIQEFEAPINAFENYGQRVRGFVIPPRSGPYTFWISSDDNSNLYLGTSEDPATKTLIASVPAWTGSREWDVYASQRSAPIQLEAGRSYYIEALMKEGTGGDNLAVRWQLPDGTIEEPIPEIRLVPFGAAITAPVIVTHPRSTNVIEGQPATFTVELSSESTLAPVTYQWFRNGVPIGGASEASYTLPAATLGDHLARFSVRASNRLGEALSQEALLFVEPDVTPPTLIAAQATGETVVRVIFSEPVDPATALQTANYTIDQGVRVLSANFGSDTSSVLLHVTPLVFRSIYTLTVNNVTDRAARRNAIAPNSQIAFVALEFAPQDIGNPPRGGIVAVTNGVDITGGGAGVSGRNDQLQFSQQQRTGDFDVEVRVQSLDLTDIWASAGLMARENLSTNSRFAAILATPTINGTFFAYRLSPTNNSAATGAFPVNYPETWLRLKRAGNLFTGFASLDGEAWSQVGSISNNMPANIFLGLTVSSHATGRVARAEFRDFADVSAEVLAAPPSDFEPIGPSSRRTGLIISEIMYHPTSRPDGKNLEFVELFNTQPFSEKLGGYRLEGTISYTVPSNLVIRPGSSVVVAQDPAAVRLEYGLTNVLGPYTGSLGNDQGTLRLINDIGGVMLELEYSDEPPWPAAADGIGHSLVLSRPSYGENDPRAWRASQNVGGSPGRVDPVQREPLKNVVINELLANSDDPQLDYIELYNHSNKAVDLSGAGLGDDPLVAAFTIPAGTFIAPRGFLAFNQNELGFALRAGGEAVYLINSSHTRVIDAVRFGGQATGVASGRYPDGAPEFRPLQTMTPGAANSGWLIPDIVINEVMFHPISEDQDEEYVELYNRGSRSVDLAGWQLSGGIEFTFPSGSLISPGAFFVVGRNAARLRANYPYLSAVNTFGDFSGQLSNGGERVALRRPGEHLPTEEAFFVTVDEVTYGDGGRWGRWADGGGSSLELVDARSDHRQPSNWADSDETHKSPWTTIEATGVLDHGNSAFQIDNLQVLLLGEGECLIDNVEVIGTAGGNLVPNSTFEGGTDGWLIRGTHIRSSFEANEGFNSSRSLHIRASARGDTAANQLTTPLTSSLQPGTIATIRAKVRWLRGHPEILLKLHGNWLEATGRMTVPPNLGTPGRPNSQAILNNGPAIFDVKHSPVLPATNEAVVVTARITDPDLVSAVFLRYRVDGTNINATVNMVDNGSGGDAVAGDGIYSATIPPQLTNLVAFTIQAFDNAPVRVAALFPPRAPEQEALIHWGESQLPGGLAAYRVWFTKATLDEWASRAPSSNDPLDATFVYGSFRAVYNIGTLYSGSPFHWTGYNSPLGNNANYLLLFRPDDPFLGQTDFVLNLPSNLGSDQTAQREQMFYSIIHELGHPYTYRRFVYLFLNGIRRGNIFEDAQQPNSDVVAEWFPQDPDGELYKIEDWFEFAEDARGFSNIDATLENFTTTDGQKKLARYRWTWRKRAVTGSANDYDSLFALADALNNSDPTNYTAAVEELVDVEEWMRTQAFRHISGDWDAYGYRRGKNMYAYKPAEGKWNLLDWDIAFAFGLGDGPTTDLFANQHFNGFVDPVVQRMYDHPPFRRIYLRALQDAVNGPLLSTNIDRVLDEKYAALTNNFLTVASPATVKSWLRLRRTNILDVLATNAASFEITANGGRDFTISSNNVVTLSGTAPVSVKTIRVNGTAYAPVWKTVTNWELQLPLTSGANLLTVQGFDTKDALIPGGSKNLRVTYAGSTEPPEGRLVINEIMYDPIVPGAGFVEIHNTSSAQTYDLSNYELKGADFIFPEGTLIGPGGFVVVASDREVFRAVYGTRIPLAGQFAGRLDNDGETLRLIRPGTPGPGSNVVAQVTYRSGLPWPETAHGLGASLQLVDPSQDNGRVANWIAVSPDQTSEGGWRLATETAVANGPSSFFLYLASSGDVYLDDLSLVAGPVPAAGPNLLQNGDFEGAFPGAWKVSTDDPETAISSTIKHAGRNSLHIVSTSGGNIFIPSLEQPVTQLQAGQVYTLSFWYFPSPSGGGMTAGIANTELQTSVSLTPVVGGAAPFTPGTVNSVRSTLPALPQVWINEVSANQSGQISDQSQERDPWIELYNSGPAPVDLSSFYLTDNFTNLLQWAFPASTVINPGEYRLIWADGEPGETSGRELHAAFRLGSAVGPVGLVQKDGSQVRVIDFVNTAVPTNHSHGFFPDGHPHPRVVFELETPGRPNDNSARPIQVRINEWMADNEGTIADPSDGQFEDWIELFNAGAAAIDLGGYTLSDDLTVPDKFTFPTGTIVPAGGYLLVWADNEEDTVGPGLHAGFGLSRNGDSIGLFAANGSLVDSVSFGAQSADVSEGRFPNGVDGPTIQMIHPTPGGPNDPTTEPSGGDSLTVSIEAGMIRLAWPVTIGHRYRVEFKNSLSDPAWQTLGDEIVATGPTATITDSSVISEDQRFYRFVLVE